MCSRRLQVAALAMACCAAMPIGCGRSERNAGQASSAQTTEQKAREAAIERLWAMPITQDWDEVSLDTVLDRLAEISGVPFSASTKARSEVFADTSISAQLDEVTVGDILEAVVTEPYGLSWYVRDGGLVVVTYAELPDGPFLRHRNVQDILLYLTIHHECEDPEAMHRLVRDLKRGVFGAQRAAPAESVVGRNGVLVVRATKEVHVSVDRALDEMRSVFRPDIASFHAR